MFRRISPHQAATILTLVTVSLVEASNKPLAAHTKSTWDEALNILVSYTLYPLSVSPAGKILTIVAIVVAALTFAFTEDNAERLVATVVLSAGILIAAGNFVGWLAG